MRGRWTIVGTVLATVAIALVVAGGAGAQGPESWYLHVVVETTDEGPVSEYVCNGNATHPGTLLGSFESREACVAQIPGGGEEGGGAGGGAGGGWYLHLVTEQGDEGTAGEYVCNRNGANPGELLGGPFDTRDLCLAQVPGGGEAVTVTEVGATVLASSGPDRYGYCSVAGNTDESGEPLGAGTFLNLLYGQPDTDPHYAGATPAFWVEGVGLTCDLSPGQAAIAAATTVEVNHVGETSSEQGPLFYTFVPSS